MMKSIKILILCITVLQITFCIGQESTLPLGEKLAVEQIYIHMDKSYYTAGEGVWFKAYVLDAKTYKPSVLSEVLYVELINTEDEVLHQRILKMTMGSAAGDFELSSQLTSGVYTLRAYTAYMRNFGNTSFFKKTILVNGADTILSETRTEKIPSVSRTFDMQFFPEGGYLVNGFLNPVGFKALDSQGMSIPISGKLMDDTGNIIKEFTSAHLGMGLFHFIPKANRTYSALVSYANQEKRFELPNAIPSGVLMTVSNQPMHYKLELRGTSDVKMKDFRLIGKQNKGSIFNLTVNANKQEHSTIIKVAKDLLEEGVLELTLFNQEKQPIAERLLFHENSADSSPLSFTMDKTVYGNRKLVELEIAMDEWTTDTPMADLSLTVTNTAVNPSKVNSTDIKTQLLLSSVLSGEIEQPGYYFYTNNPNRQTHLDILMRTQGWRQYVLDDEISNDDYFLPEKGLSISGKVVSSFNENEPLLGTVKLTYDNAEQMILDEVKTDYQGRFTFPSLAFTDTTSVLLSANVNYVKKKRKETSNYKILLDPKVSPPISKSKQKEKSIAHYSQAKEEAHQNSVALLQMANTIELDEAFVAAKKQPKPLDRFQLKRRGMPYKVPSQTLDFNDLDVPMDEPLLTLQGRVPGLSVRINGIFLRGASSLTGNNSALILVDGIPFAEANLLLTSEIDFIDILKGPRAAIYGSRAANGVIAIFTKNGTESYTGTKQNLGSINFKDAGYDYARNFYEPKYAKNQPETKVPDYRTTLLWQPYISLNQEGKARISFYSGDVTGDYQVTIEGITATGRVITSKAYFEIINDAEYP
jgi:TonB-dependent SusC/RagA subfamily outer membrane receptor